MSRSIAIRLAWIVAGIAVFHAFISIARAFSDRDVPAEGRQVWQELRCIRGTLRGTAFRGVPAGAPTASRISVHENGRNGDDRTDDNYMRGVRDCMIS